VDRRPLGRTGFSVTPIGFGAFKIGRNQAVKYSSAYELPDEATAGALLRGVLDAGVNYIDTAPAYGLSEERIGRALGPRTAEIVVSTKVGEELEGGRSRYDFSVETVRGSVRRSLARLGRTKLDVVFIHAPADDVAILRDTSVIETLTALKRDGVIAAVGFSGKTIQGAEEALGFADVLMVEYNLRDRSHAGVIGEAAALGIGVVVKKGLASGHLRAAEAIEFVLGTEGVSTVVIGGLDLAHVRDNIAALESFAAYRPR
jgi:aryl-alcohol dehydrogenase-like predicted oxidoreductase